MQDYYFDTIKREIASGKVICEATIVEVEGTTPREVGTSMIIKADGTTEGTIGGGQLEYIVIKEALQCIEGQSSTIKEVLSYKNHDENQEVISRVTVFLRVYLPQDRLVIFGAGHVGYSLYNLAVQTHFSVILLDEREGFFDDAKYPHAAQLIRENTLDAIDQRLITPNTYVVVVSSTHKSDEEILKRVIQYDCQYVGMLGSKRKVANIFKNILESGIEEEKLQKVYAPIGLEIGGETPEEVALSILSQIVAVKNGKEDRVRHMKR
ncbi:XdhC/CoxI family protein [Irregularibacter muris]|uniref:XdhC/CoxI family protein n=1 Tax=Irregularibacter muris TaxID=1796619 RepID=A0AAE3HHY2_9FIRM|nr:XdhC/CoxI family protein [Irregularibacter muris]MCR1899720.1 XdhC/CoxI family protein [Irregularibacter muris]